MALFIYRGGEKVNQVILKKGKEKALKNHHHWIFSGAIEVLPTFNDGEILGVRASNGQFLGHAYFNRKAKIIGRMVNFDESDPVGAIRSNVRNAILMRKQLFDFSQTNAYRLINGEGDYIPGLIVDVYGDRVVVQCSTLGIERLRDRLIEILIEELQPRSIYEKSQLPSRKEEGLGDKIGLLYGEPVEEIVVVENGLKFLVNVVEGQKTGFFLDHREMRQKIGRMAKGKRILNCFSYTGGFSVYAAAGGALNVNSVDISEKAVAMAEKNFELNGFATQKNGFFANDVFRFLREQPLDYEMVILDPPAFAKRQKDVIQGCRGYKDINRVAMQKMPKGSFLLTCSCSYHVNEDLFQKVVFQAAVEADRNVRIIDRHHMAADHPVNICHPESDYLKSLLLYVE